MILLSQVVAEIEEGEREWVGKERCRSIELAV